MALKDLSSQTMVHVSGTWLDRGGDRPALERLTRVKPLLPDLDDAHAALVASHNEDTTVGDQVAAIRAEQARFDEIHDRKARGVLGALASCAQLADDPADAARALATRDALFPEGLRFITRSYTTEAGEVRLARARLDDDKRAMLASVSFPGGTLMDAVNAWFEAGDKLGALEDRRIELEAGDVPRASRGEQRKARNRWIRVVRAILSMMELEALTDDQRAVIVGVLERELAKAERRVARGGETAGGDAAGGDAAPVADGAASDG